MEYLSSSLRVSNVDWFRLALGGKLVQLFQNVILCSLAVLVGRHPQKRVINLALGLDGVCFKNLKRSVLRACNDDVAIDGFCSCTVPFDFRPSAFACNIALVRVAAVVLPTLPQFKV